MRRLGRGELIRFLALALSLNLSAAAHASGTVTTCTEAELTAAMLRGGLVTLACDGTVNLTSPIMIARETVLDGTGHSPVITAGATNLSPLFYVAPGASLTLRHLSVEGATSAPLTPTNSVSGRSGEQAEGAALYINHGIVTLDGCTFSGHKVTGGEGARATSAGGDGGDGGSAIGAAILNFGGRLLITNSTFSFNSATGGPGGNGARPLTPGNGGSGGRGGAASGAAIYSTGQALLTIYDSTFLHNTAAGGQAGAGGNAVDLGVAGKPGVAGDARGAAVFNDSGQVTIFNSTFTDNLATGAAGIGNVGDTNSVFAQSGSPGGNALGGGVFNRSGTVVLNHCRFVRNSLVGGAGGAGGTGVTAVLDPSGGDGGDGGAAIGGGVYTAVEGTTVVVDSTFSDNTVTGGVGGRGGLGGRIAASGLTGRTGLEAGAAWFDVAGRLQVVESISVQPKANELWLSWPDVSDFILQTSQNLAATNSWRPVASQPVSDSGVSTLRITPTNPAAFYRLRAR